MPGGRGRGFPGEARPRVGRVARLQPRPPMSTRSPWSERGARAASDFCRARVGRRGKRTTYGQSVSVSVIQVLRYSRVVTFSCGGAKSTKAGLRACLNFVFFFEPCWILQFRASVCFFFGCVWASAVVFGLVWPGLGIGIG